MSDYRCFAFSNYEIDKETYNYLLPIYGICAFENGFKRNESSPFIFVNNEKCFFLWYSRRLQGDGGKMQISLIITKAVNELNRLPLLLLNYK